MSTGMTLDFGRHITWTSDLDIPLGHQMTFKDALHNLCTKIMLKMIVPEWAKNLTKEISSVHLAFNKLEVCHLGLFVVPVVRGIDAPRFKQKYMLEMVEACRNGDKVEERYDLFSGLLDAAGGELDGRTGLHDRELVGEYPHVSLFLPLGGILHSLGNMFVFLLAGHEVRLGPLFLHYGLKGFPTDHSAHVVLHVCIVGPSPR